MVFVSLVQLIHLWLHVIFNREAFSSTPVSKEQANALVLTIARFIDACDAHQIRVAPDKCNCLDPKSIFQFLLRKLQYLLYDTYWCSFMSLQSSLFARGSKIKFCYLKLPCGVYILCWLLFENFKSPLSIWLLYTLSFFFFVCCPRVTKLAFPFWMTTFLRLINQGIFSFIAITGKFACLILNTSFME